MVLVGNRPKRISNEVRPAERRHSNENARLRYIGHECSFAMEEVKANDRQARAKIHAHPHQRTDRIRSCQRFDRSRRRLASRPRLFLAGMPGSVCSPNAKSFNRDRFFHLIKVNPSSRDFLQLAMPSGERHLDTRPSVLRAEFAWLRQAFPGNGRHKMSPLEALSRKTRATQTRHNTCFISEMSGVTVHRCR